jgi:hypothetical protein
VFSSREPVSTSLENALALPGRDNDNSAEANRGEYEGAIISTQLRGWQLVTHKPALTLICRARGC